MAINLAQYLICDSLSTLIDLAHASTMLAICLPRLAQGGTSGNDVNDAGAGMKELKRLTDHQKAVLVQFQVSVPETISVDDIMALGSARLITFSKSKGLTLTERGERLIEQIAHR